MELLDAITRSILKKFDSREPPTSHTQCSLFLLRSFALFNCFNPHASSFRSIICKKDPPISYLFPDFFNWPERSSLLSLSPPVSYVQRSLAGFIVQGKEEKKEGNVCNLSIPKSVSNARNLVKEYIYRERERLVALADIRKTIVINELLQRIAIEFIRNFYSRTNFIPRVPCVARTKPRRSNVDDFFVKETEGRKGEGDNRVSPGISENLLLSTRETHGRARNVSPFPRCHPRRMLA